MRLLIIEDNAVLSELLAKGLRTAGYETDLLGTAAYDVVISAARASAAVPNRSVS